MKKLFTIAVVLLAGCGSSTIDGSSEDAYKASIEKMKSGMTAEEKEEFNNALVVVGLSHVDNIFDLKPGAAQETREKMDGMTVEDVLAKAKAVQAKLDAEKLEAEKAREDELKQKIAELEKQKADAQQAVEELKDAFTVKSASIEPDDFGLTLVIEVQNNTQTPVATVSMHATLTTPGRSVPWEDEEFSYRVKGGLEPGESDTWRLNPRWKMPGEENLVAEVYATEILGPNDETIKSGKWNEFQERELQRLKDQLAN